MFQQPQYGGGVPSLPLSNAPLGSSARFADHHPQQYPMQAPQHTQQRPRSPGALDVINAERVRAQMVPYDAQEDVRTRDQSYANAEQHYYTARSKGAAAATAPFARSPYASASGMGGTGEGNFVASSERERMKEFHSTRTNTLRPIVFQPNGSFRALKENGKLAVGPEEASVYKGRIKNPLSDTAYHLPVSTGRHHAKQADRKSDRRGTRVAHWSRWCLCVSVRVGLHWLCAWFPAHLRPHVR